MLISVINLYNDIYEKYKTLIIHRTTSKRGFTKEVKNTSRLELYSIDFLQSNWSASFERRKEYINSKYHNKDHITNYHFPQYIDNYSNIALYKVNNSLNNGYAFSIILMNNVCYEIGTNNLYIYKNDQENIPKSAINSLHSFFNIRVENSSIPSEHYVNTTNNWLLKLFNTLNIGHFLEVAMYLLHYYHNINIFPNIDTLYLVKPYEQLGHWKKAYLSSVLRLIQEVKPIELIDYKLMKEMEKSLGGLICFRNIGIATKISNTAYGGVLMHKYECDTLRATMYKYYGFNPDTFPHDHLNVVLIQRSPPKGKRLIGNYDEIIDMLDYARTHILSGHILSQVVFERLTFEEQLNITVHGDIFIGVVGSSSINMIYMLPHSVVISAMPPYQNAMFFHTLAELANIHYMLIVNTTAPIVDECKQYITKLGQIKTNLYCHWLYYNSDVYIPPGVLYSYLFVAKEYLYYHKYHFLN